MLTLTRPSARTVLSVALVLTLSKPSDEPMVGSGFAWRDGVLYYLVTPMLLAFVPAFADEFAAASELPR